MFSPLPWWGQTLHFRLFLTRQSMGRSLIFLLGFHDIFGFLSLAPQLLSKGGMRKVWSLPAWHLHQASVRYAGVIKLSNVICKGTEGTMSVPFRTAL